MNTKKILLSALISCLAVSAWAEDAADQQAGGPSPMTGASVDPLRGKVVKNAPFSATGDQKTQRNLADGNQITSQTSTRYYRDSLGNSRQETISNNGEVQSIMIQTADNTYTLVPAAKLALKLSLDKIAAKAKAIG